MLCIVTLHPSMANGDDGRLDEMMDWLRARTAVRAKRRVEVGDVQGALRELLPEELQKEVEVTVERYRRGIRLASDGELPTRN